MRWLVFISAVLAVSIPCFSSGEELHGRIEAPPGVAVDSLRVYFFDRNYSEIENDDHAPNVEAGVDANGLFHLTATSPTLAANLEIWGDGVRRARFPWPAGLSGEAPAARALFRVERGAASTLIVRDAASGAPVANALIGPIGPDESANVKDLDRIYPFFARTDSGGRARLMGLTQGVGYSANVTADGYVRRKAAFAPGAEVSIELARGGAVLAGEVRGHASSLIYPGVVVAMSGGPQGLYAQRRSGEDGKFEFNGLMPGRYSLQALAPDRGVTMPTELDVPASGLSGVWLPYPEGIVVAGRTYDVETGEGLPGVAMQLIGSTVMSKPDGAFEFPRLLGPWPATLRAEHPQYVLDEEALNRDLRHPIDGIAMDDVLGLETPLRRKRVLVIQWDDRPPNAPPAALELWGPVSDNAKPDVVRHRISAASQALPLKTSGARAALIRTADGMVSDFLPVHTPLEATTTTLAFRLDAGAAIDGSLTYEEGSPTPAYRIEILKSTNDASVPNVLIREATPDGDGKFFINGLPPGAAHVRLLRPGGSAWFEEEINLERGVVSEFHRTTIRGHGLAGHVVDEHGSARGGIALTAYGRDPQGHGLRLETVSGDDGKFRFDGFGGEALDELRVAHADYMASSRRQIPLPDDNYLLELVPRAGVTVTLQAHAAELESARAWLMLAIEHMSPEGDRFWHFSAEQRQAFGGEESLRFTPASHGRYCVAVDVDGMWTASEVFEWNPGGESRAIELNPRDTGSLTLNIVDAEADEVAALEFELKNAALPPEADEAVLAGLPDIQNTTARFRDVVPGLYHLTVKNAAGSEWKIFNMAIAPGAEARRTLSLKKNLIRVGGVVSIGGKESRPAESAKVQIYLNVPESPPLEEMTCDADGRFAFENLEADRPYLLRASLDGLTATHEVSPEAANQSVDVSIVLIPTVRVRLIAPRELLEAFEAKPNQPIIMMRMTGGDSLVLQPGMVEEERPMTPGRWRVSWGEEPLGEIEVPANLNRDEVADITLPSP